MFFVNPLFWIIVGLGLAIPATATILINMTIKIREGDNYQISIIDMFKVYLVALIGWGIFFSEVMG